MKTIPLEKDSPHFSFSIDLDNQNFGFEFLWNHRDNNWYMSISDVNGDLILSSARLSVATSLLGRYRDARLPLGDLFFLDTIGEAEAGYGDLVVRHQLIYITAAEL